MGINKDVIGDFEVYSCFYDGELVYIGCGKTGRSKHCTSGRSHCKALNEIVKSEGKEVLEIKINRVFSNKYYALQYEARQILKKNPKFNKSIPEEVKLDDFCDPKFELKKNDYHVGYRTGYLKISDIPKENNNR